jgi:hypothetical protein
MEKGEEPTWEEMGKLLLRIGEKMPKIRRVDPHCATPDNFLRNERGYVAVDYGDTGGASLQFTDFIIQNKDELAEILRQT